MAVAVSLALLLGACTGRPPTPTGYGDTTRSNFTTGCERFAAGDGISDPQSYCRCAYDAVVRDVPFDEFKDINAALSENPAVLPEELLTIRDDCVSTS